MISSEGWWDGLVNVLGQLGAGMLTVVVGVTVFVVTQGLAKLAIEPSLELRRVVGRIAHALVFYANVHANVGALPDGSADSVQKVYRELASDLKAAAASIPHWARGPMAWLGIIPPWNNIRSSANDLIGLSNSLHATSPYRDVPVENTKRAESIKCRLGIDPFE